MIEEHHKGDIGTKIILVIYKIVNGVESILDISSASTKEIIFEKSDGTFVTKTGVFYTDGTDGKLYYETIADDLNMTGSWKAQAKVIMTGTWFSSVIDFEVYENLE